MGKALISESILTRLADKIRYLNRCGKRDESVYTPEECISKLDLVLNYEALAYTRITSATSGGVIPILNNPTFVKEYNGSHYNFTAAPYNLNVAMWGTVTLKNSTLLPPYFLSVKGNVTKIDLPLCSTIREYGCAEINKGGGLNGRKPSLITVNAPMLEQVNHHAFFNFNGGTERLKINCPNLKTIESNAFDCSNSYLQSYLDIDLTSATTIASYAFYHRSSSGHYLVFDHFSLDGTSDNRTITIGSNAFYSANLSAGYAGEGKVAYLKNCSISGSAFSYAVLPPKVVCEMDSVNSWGNSAFYYTSGLQEFWYKKQTGAIPANAFCGSSIKNFIIDNESSSVVGLANANAFSNTAIASGTGYIYVPDALVEDYKVATNWAVYAAQIKPLSEFVEVQND